MLWEEFLNLKAHLLKAKNQVGPFNIPGYQQIGSCKKRCDLGLIIRFDQVKIEKSIINDTKRYSTDVSDYSSRN